MRTSLLAIRIVNKRLLLGIAILLIVFHCARVFIEVQHIQDAVHASALRAAPEMESAVQEMDLFSLKRSLYRIKPPEATWLKFDSSLSNKLGSGPILIGDAQSSHLLVQSSLRPLGYRGRNIGTLEYGISPISVSSSILRQNLFSYLAFSLFAVGVVSFAFFEAIRAIGRVEKDLETLALAAENYPLESKLDALFDSKAFLGNNNGFAEVYLIHLRKIVGFVRQMNNSEKKIEVLQAQAQLAAQVSHDIRSPLSALNMVIKQIGSLTPEQQSLIEGAVARINGIANDLLEQHRSLPALKIATPTDLKMDIRSAHIGSLLKAIFEEKRAALFQNGEVDLRLDLKGPVDACCAIDQKELSRALSNLINNAVESLTEGGVVTIALRAAVKGVAIIVNDNGCGIPDDVLHLLGSERLSHGKTSGESGAGLGVLHAKSAVDAMGGSFVIQSRIGLGTQITITFPRLKETVISNASIC